MASRKQAAGCRDTVDRYRIIGGWKGSYAIGRYINHGFWIYRPHPLDSAHDEDSFWDAGLPINRAGRLFGVAVDLIWI